MLGALLGGGMVEGALAGEIQTAPLNPAFVEFAAEAAEPRPRGGTEAQNALGWRPGPVDLGHLRTSTVAPRGVPRAFDASFDLRTQGKLTSVKNQNPYGTCWAHATYASMESALLPGETNNFSENNLVNLHGFDWGFNDGGNAHLSMAYLTRWDGPVDEADDPYYNIGGSTGNETVRRHVQEVLLIPAKSGPTNNDTIKQALLDYGAVYVNYYHHDTYYNTTHKSYYYSGASNGNHAVAIVGWNDNYPSNQFNSVAPGDGAYIVKNSWGTGWGESGYFYASYYDSKFANNELFVFHDAESTSNYSRVYDYDPLGWVSALGTGSGTTFWGANLFTAAADEDLAAVGFYASSASTAYEIYIYKGITAGAPRSGTLAVSNSGTRLVPGYCTIDLSTPVALTNGQRFSIVLKLTTPGNNYPQPFEYALAGYSSAATASAGQSYYSSAGSSWTDLTMYDATANFCIKGYAASDEPPPAAPASIWASATNAAGFTAAWSAVAAAASYRLDVATDSSFTGGGSPAGRILLASNAATSPSLIAGDWSGTDLGGTTYVIMTQATSQVVSPAFSTVGFTNLTVDFRARTYGGTAKSNITISISTNNGSTWSAAGVVNPLNGSTFSTIPTLTNTTLLGHAQTRVRWQSLDAGTGMGVGISNLVVRGWSTGSSGSYVSGYSNRTVSGTSESVTGLVETTEYFFRVRAVNDGGTSPNSPTGSVTTLGETPGTPPVVNAISLQNATVGELFDYEVTATATDGDPILSFACMSAVETNRWDFDVDTGFFLFDPVETGTVEFQFTATDKDGTSDPVSMTVTVSAAVGTPTVSFDAARVYGEEGEGPVSLPVSLSFAADATVQVVLAGTALPGGVDFTCSTTTLVFTATGSPSTNLLLTVVDDDLPEGPESARFTLNPVAGVNPGATTQAVFFIRDNDAFSIVAANLTSGIDQEYLAPGERILQALCPDVVLIQEALLPGGGFINRSWVDEHFGTHYHYFIESEGGGMPIPNGIISRWPIVASGEWEDSEVSNRDFAWAKIDLPGIRDLYAVSVHFLTTGESSREAQARSLTNSIALAGWSPDDYWVVGGDLNLGTRNETALRVLTNIVSDVRKPADQNLATGTSQSRVYPYDYVLPNPVLDARHQPVGCYGHVFTNGLVFDTRLAWAGGLPPPATTNDSNGSALPTEVHTNMQHMAVVKVFALEGHLEAPQAFSAVAAGLDQIDLAWTLNSSLDDVLVVWNTDGVFGTPSGAPPSVGSPFAGGTVLYRGMESPVAHTGLDGCSTYFYRCWSVATTNYSEGLSASASTEAPSAPASVWAAATNSSGFTAAWSAVPGVSEYRLDVSTNETFGGAGGSGTAYVVDFEDATKSSYVPGNVDLNGISWNLNQAVTGDLAEDRKNGTKSARVRSNETVNSSGMLTMNADTNMGLSAITFLHARYGGDAAASGRADYSTNGGASWISAGTFDVTTTDLTLFTATNLNVAGHVRVRVVKTSGATRYNIDDITLHPYSMSPSFVGGYSNRVVTGATSVAVTGLTAGVTYYFRVRAADGACIGAYSPTGQVTTASGASPQAITFPAIGTQIETSIVVLAATASSGLPVSFAVGGGPAQIDGGTTLSFTGTGTVSIVASQGGNETWQAAPEVTNTFDVLAGSTSNRFTVWLENDQGQNPVDPDFAWDADVDGDGATTWEEFLANTDPDNAADVLWIAGESLIGSGTGETRVSFPASSGRYYQFIHATSLFSAVSVSNLGWGIDGTVVFTNDIPGRWYGGIRVWLEEPPE